MLYANLSHALCAVYIFYDQNEFLPFTASKCTKLELDFLQELCYRDNLRNKQGLFKRILLYVKLDNLVRRKNMSLKECLLICFFRSA